MQQSGDKNSQLYSILLIFGTVILVLAVNFVLFIPLVLLQSLKYTYFLIFSVLTLVVLYLSYRQRKKLQIVSRISQSLEKQQAKRQRDLEMARQVQQSLLGQRTLISRELKIVANSRPAEKIGGDFYTFTERTINRTYNISSRKGIVELQNQMDRTVSVCIGDVAGHGIASALIMLLAKSLLDQLIYKYPSPAKVFSIANKQIKAHTEQSEISFVTVALVQINLDTNAMTYAKAGHTDTILMHSDGTLTPLPTEGVFLGMFDNPDFEEKQIQLRAGDRVILYTDGIIETRNPQGEIYSASRFYTFLMNNHTLPIEELISAIYKELEDFSQKQEVADDATLVIVEMLQ